MEEDVLILLGVAFNLNLPLLTAWLLDHWLGDPAWLPHPVVAFGKAISFCEHRLNRGDSCFLKGAFVAVSLVLGVYVITLLLLRLAALFSPGMLLTVQILLIFYCLAGTTLVREVRMVFKAVDRSLEEGRMQVARIVGRDTSALLAQEVRTAALETLAENLSDGKNYIVTSGLKPGDKIVVEGVQTLKDGQTITPITPEQKEAKYQQHLKDQKEGNIATAFK